mgnify:CR=1 FL=1
MKAENEGRAQLQVVDPEKSLADTAPQGPDKNNETWRVATALDEERWTAQWKELYAEVITTGLSIGQAIAEELGISVTANLLLRLMATLAVPIAAVARHISSRLSALP